MTRPHFRVKSSALIAASVALVFADGPAFANPTGPHVVHGSASFRFPSPNVLRITSSPGAIINWQGFAIGAGEVTRFIQQSRSSTVLNRVVGPDISRLSGTLSSNGRVFLINPAGIVVGPGGVIDTAGFVGSTLNMLDGDFIAGRLNFQGDAAAGRIVNHGWIRTAHGGHVIFVAPHIENTGLISTPGGELILAAGQKLTITSLDLDGVQFEIQAPGDSVVNVGRLLASGGAVGVFAGTLRHSGEIRANSLAYDEAGRVVLKAQHEMQVLSGSTIAADGHGGGSIALQTTDGATRVAGSVSARGEAERGGDIKVLGAEVSLVENAALDASGSTGGGRILVGGGFQGASPLLQNSSSTFVGSRAALRADAQDAGDGGRIIVWSDGNTQFYGNLSAQGGPQGGNGGFGEVSGKQNLIFAGGANLGAAKGSLGDLLLDPLDLYVFAGGGKIAPITDEAADFPNNAATVDPATLAGITGNVTLYASRYMRIKDPITLTTAGQGFTATVGTYVPPALPDPVALNPNNAPNRLDIAASITTNAGAVALSAPAIQGAGAPVISTGGGAINLAATGSIFASGLALNAAGGTVDASAGSSLQLGDAVARTFSVTAPSSIVTGAIATAGRIRMTASSGSISTGALSSGGGNVTLDGASASVAGIAAGSGAVSVKGTAGVSSGLIDTTGTVVLDATGGSVFATVDNASNLSATGAGTVSISSGTDVNIAIVSAGGLASISTTDGTLRATGATALVEGLDVTLSTGALTGGGIFGTGPAQPLNVDVQRTFTFRPNGRFNVALAGPGPNRLFAEMGIAPPGQSYSGTLTGPGLTLSASANESTVTLNDFSVTSGFNQAVALLNPEISFRVPNGALSADSVMVPRGGTVTSATFPNGIPLPVTLSASGDLTLNSYARAPGGPSKQTTISSTAGNIILGDVDAGKDSVSVSAPGGNITVGSLTSDGNIGLTAPSGTVRPQNDTAAVEIASGGALSISAQTIGAGNFTAPLDLNAPAISLTSLGGAIGGTGSRAVIANTPNLTVNAASTFNVSTGPTALDDLTVTASPLAVGAGGVAQVRTQTGSGNERLYSFASDGTNFSLALGTVPATQFNDGTFSFIASSGDISVAGATHLGTGSLVLSTNGNNISTGGTSISAANVTLISSNNIDTGALTATGPGGGIVLTSNGSVTTGTLNAPGSIEIGARFCCSFPAVTTGAIGNSTAPAGIEINGSTVSVGAVTGAGDVTLKANTALLTLGGAVNTANGSSIELLSADPSNAFQFTRINAGATGSVNITSGSNIYQTSVGATSGITAGTVSLTAGGEILRNTPSDPLDLRSTTDLTVDSVGQALLNANGSTLSSLKITRHADPGIAPFTLTGLGGGQTVTLGQSVATELEVNSPSSSLNFELLYPVGSDVELTGAGIVTSGGNATLSLGGGVNGTVGGITTAGGNATITVSGGVATLGGISTGGGTVSVNTFCVACHIDVTDTINAGAGTVSFFANDGNIAGAGTITSSTSVSAFTSNGAVGSAGLTPVPLAISAPTVNLTANRGFFATANEGSIRAALSGTTDLTLRAERNFNVTNNTAFTDLAVSTPGSGVGIPVLGGTLGGQSYTFARPAGTDLFGSSLVDTFEVVSVNAPTASATFTALDGTLLVRGAPGAPNKIDVQNLTLSGENGATISLQGNAANPLNLASANQTFSAFGAGAGDLLIRGTAELTATASQLLVASGNIRVDADAGALGGGTVILTAPDQTLRNQGGVGRIELLGGSSAGERVVVKATAQQLIDTTSTSANSFRMVGGDGTNASVTLRHTGTGVQHFQVSSGTVTVQGGDGTNAYARIAELGTRTQQLCRDTPTAGCGAPIGTLNILGGAGSGAFAEITAARAQISNITTATNVKGGAGDGAYALMQAGTSQTFLNAGNMLVRAGTGTEAQARVVVANGPQSIWGSSLTVAGGGAEAAPVAGALAIVEGRSQVISMGSGGITITGGSGLVDTTSDARILNLSGDQIVSTSGSIVLNGGHQHSAAAIVNQGAGTQTVTGSAGITLRSDIDGHANSSVLIENVPATAQTINASFGNVRLNNRGGGIVGITSAGTQSVTARALDVRTESSTESGPASATIAAGGDQRIRTLDGTTSGFGSLRVAALGSGTAGIEAGASQLLELDYPDLLQAGGHGGLTVGDVNAAGTSRIKAVDQTIFAGSITVQSGSANSLSEIKASNVQTISTLTGGISVLGGSGNNSLAQIDPLTQTILANGTINVVGGSGVNAIAQIVSGGGQTLLATSGDVTLTGGGNTNASALITTTGPASSIGAADDIVLTPGTGSNADAIIGVGNGAGNVVLTCGGACALSSIIPGPGSDAGVFGNPGGGVTTTPALPPDVTSTIIALQQDQGETLLETTPDGTAEEQGTAPSKAPICR
jgi:filamentous hemagglutinin family protein